MRLKSGTEGDSGDQTDISSWTDQAILEDLYDFYGGNSGGNLNDYYNLSSINWGTSGMGDSYISGYGTINGNQYSYYMCNACYYQPSNDCWANDIGIVSSTSYSDRTHYYVRNCDGLPLVTITHYH